MHQLIMNPKAPGDATQAWSKTQADDEILLHAVRTLNSAILGIVLGLISGVGLFVVTLWLVLKGGPMMGQHLSLLNQFLPGYNVSVLGSFVGLFYGIVLGFVGGWFIGWVYNSIVSLRHRGSGNLIIRDN